MKAIRTALLFAGSVVTQVSPAFADPPDATPEAQPPVIIGIDFDTIPRAALPAMPAEADAAQASAVGDPVHGVRIKKVENPFGMKKLSASVRAKLGKVEIVEVAPSEPAIAAMYFPQADGTDFEGESLPRVNCHRDESPSNVRWETVNVGADGTAHLTIRDLRFDPHGCKLGAVATSDVAFKPIAYDGAKPWLFAVRDDKSVTFLMARSNDVTADAMVGSPVTVRGAFTRVTLPVGRWGSSSFVANLASLELKAPAVPDPARRRQGKASEEVGTPETSDQPIEIAVELVQTMSEPAPTLLVRRALPDIVPEQPEARLTID
jgi:hypothetical protein